MMNKELQNQNEQKQLNAVNKKSVKELLEQMKGEIARCLPKHLTPERMTRIALTELRKTPKLQQCDPMSFIAAIMQASQLGLEPGVLGSCYLIPFWNKHLNRFECTFMPGYRGFLDLARRSGQIVSLVARAVYENDEFEYEFGLKENIIHKPNMNEKGSLVAVYAVALLKDGGYQFDVMSKKEVDAIRATSKSKNDGPWVTNYEEMAKKTVLRRLFKWLPCSVEMQKAVSLDELQEAGIQNIKAAAAEEFDIDFLKDGGEVYENEIPGETQTERLKNAIKQQEEDTDTKDMKAHYSGRDDVLISPEQQDEISSIMLEKDFKEEKIKKILDSYKVSKLEELTDAQARLFLLQLGKV